MLRKDLRQNLAKEQQQEGDNHRLNNELESIALEHEQRVDDIRHLKRNSESPALRKAGGREQEQAHIQ